MAIRARRILGIAVEDRSLLAAELQVSGARRVLRRAAEFAYPDGLSLDEPVRLGRALRAFLRQHRFTARQVVVGVPARWLLVQEKFLPPATGEAMAGMVRLAAEQAFSDSAADLAMDYADGSATAAGTHPVLVVATPRRRLEQLTALARGAGLTMRAIAPSVMALGAAHREPAASELTLYLRPGNTEVALRTGGRFPVVKHLPAAPAPDAEAAGAANGRAECIAAQVRQVVALLPADGALTEPETLVVWDGANPQPGDLDALATRLSARTVVGHDLSPLGVSPARSDGDEATARFAAPVALALAGVQPELLAVDLLHSRLAPPRRSSLGRKAVWAGFLVAALATAATFLVMDGLERERTVAALRAQMAALKPDIEAAQAVVDRMASARGWHDRRPPFLDCLRELTLAFPEQGTIWATSLAIREDMRAVVSGKSVNEATVLEALDRLKQSKALAGVKLLHMREAGGRSREVSFAIRFTFMKGG